MATVNRHGFCCAVVGPGAVGGLLAGVLTHHGVNVICVATRKSSERLRTMGLHVESDIFGSFEARCEAREELSRPVDVIFLTTKSYDLDSALSRIRVHSSDAIVVPLLNGVDHLAQMRAFAGERLAVGTVSVEVSRDSHGVIHHTSRHMTIEIASVHERYRARLDQLRDILINAGVACELLPREEDVVWRKLARLCPLAAATAFFQEPIGTILQRGEMRAVLERCLRESIQVAAAVGVNLSFVKEMRRIELLPPTFTSSLSRDITDGRLTEVETILGGVLRTGHERAVACPEIEKIYLALL